MIYLHLFLAVSLVMIGYEIFMMRFEDNKQDFITENYGDQSPSSNSKKDVIFYLGYDFEGNKFDLPEVKVEPKLNLREQGRIWMENARLVQEYYRRDCERRFYNTEGSFEDVGQSHKNINEENIYVH